MDKSEGADWNSHHANLPALVKTAQRQEKNSPKTKNPKQLNCSGYSCGGSCEIRTHGGRKTSPVFKTGAFNRSAKLPLVELDILTGCFGYLDIGESMQRRKSKPSLTYRAFPGQSSGLADGGKER